MRPDAACLAASPKAAKIRTYFHIIIIPFTAAYFKTFFKDCAISNNRVLDFLRQRRCVQRRQVQYINYAQN